MDSEQELQLQITKKAVQDWRDEQREAADGLAMARTNAVNSVRRAAEAGISQATIAEACGWPRQRVHQFLNES